MTPNSMCGMQTVDRSNRCDRNDSGESIAPRAIPCVIGRGSDRVEAIRVD